MRREICGEKKTSKRLTQTQWGWTQQSVLSSLVCSHPSYPCMSLILDYKESGGVAFTTKETCTAGRTKKEWEPCASAKAGISLLHSPPHILFTRLPSPNTKHHQTTESETSLPPNVSTSPAILQALSLSLSLRVALASDLRWQRRRTTNEIFNTSIFGCCWWRDLGWLREKSWGWWGGLKPLGEFLKPITSAFFCFTDSEAWAFVKPENDLNWHSLGCWWFTIFAKK